jgi:hypothetical protein
MIIGQEAGLIRTILSVAALAAAVVAANVSATTITVAEGNEAATAGAVPVIQAVATVDTAAVVDTVTAVEAAVVDTDAVADTLTTVEVEAVAVDTDIVVDTVTTVETVSVDTVITIETETTVVDTYVVIDTTVVIDCTVTETEYETTVIIDYVAVDYFEPQHQRAYLLSARNEILIVMGEISTVGLNFEVGLFDVNGFYVSADFGGGANYYGFGINVGYSFTGYGNTSHIVGMSGNFHNTALVANFASSAGTSFAREVGINRNFAGVFWKLIPWPDDNLDVTNRLLFGYRRDSAWWDKSMGEIYYKKGFSVTYSLTAGYTLIRRSR